MSFDAIGIVSSDLQRSVKFYEILGLNFEEVGSPDHLEAKTSSGIRIMLDSVSLVKKINPDWEESTGGGAVLCFKQESATKVDELFDEIVQAGFTSIKEPWDAFWGQRYSSVQDPDQNQIDIFATL
ncbi:MAG: VOC family protein [Nitrospinota bacterium]